jgi:lysophospholipase L1-like esterase
MINELMFNQPVPKINKTSKVIVGIGDSFTQGVGSWSTATYEAHSGWIDPLTMWKDNALVAEMYENSWVSQICRNHLVEYIPVNLGVMGTGNRAAVKELYLHPELNLDTAQEVIVVYLLSGIERFDFVHKDFNRNTHFYTMWPNYRDKNTTNKKLWQAYSESLWSDRFSVVESILNIKEAESICKSKGWKLVVASAFEQVYIRDYFIEHLDEGWIPVVDTIDWNNFVYPNGMKSFMEMLLDCDGNRHMADGQFYDYYSILDYPTKHITNCMHPTKEGYRIIAEEIYKSLQKNTRI